ncbi:D-alanyl-D-alanine carboxypeptidase [Reichenbachiella agarivorans]|uniref:D-alanyl-D-alanine carboxypeptidase n=1 Tax=Reichenbachiella agarivorans TaxID=2979464 RepID=A0ABY6CN20_9BACT|nr:D-alanyl-D-alanine carboxypeptidase [Reichenbachiella agarivorans]UXP31914.1 D-alanyl-D-alanine carboxypeptidase [Reichenbachiella agarivorans]
MKFIPSLSVAILLLLTSCATLKTKVTNKKVIKAIEKDEVYDTHFTGFVLHDPSSHENLIEINADRFFTPASNTKLTTLYACLLNLGDSIPGLKYEIQNDTLYFTGTGDPSFLNPDFPNQPVFDFLRQSKYTLVYVEPRFLDDTQAAGWAWEDYEYYFQPERNGFPIYGNTLHFVYDSISNHFDIEPPFFSDYVTLYPTYDKSYKHARDLTANIFHFAPDTTRAAYKNRIPFKTSDEMTFALLEDTLRRSLGRIAFYEFQQPLFKYAIESKDLYALMLKRSDNFIAEQLIYVTTQEMGLEMSFAALSQHVMLRELDPLRSQVEWKDGSGLSRYNLATPTFMIELLQLILQEITMDELKALLPAGGKEGTMKDWYQPAQGQEPYIYAKTGTLSNIHNLTGIIQTKSGKNLLFTYMNNNYKGGSYPVKRHMQKVLTLIRDKY